MVGWGVSLAGPPETGIAGAPSGSVGSPAPAGCFAAAPPAALLFAAASRGCFAGSSVGEVGFTAASWGDRGWLVRDDSDVRCRRPACESSTRSSCATAVMSKKILGGGGVWGEV